MLGTASGPLRFPQAACAQPDVDPDWWDVASPAAENARAKETCLACPELDACALAAALEKPQGLIQAGRRWDQAKASTATN